MRCSGGVQPVVVVVEADAVLAGWVLLDWVRERAAVGALAVGVCVAGFEALGEVAGEHEVIVLAVPLAVLAGVDRTHAGAFARP